MFTWLIITLWCNFPKQALWVVGVRAVGLWLVQNAPTTKSFAALGPGLGSPPSNPTPTPFKCPQAFRNTLANVCCIYFTFPFKSTLPFVPCNGQIHVLPMQVKDIIYIKEKKKTSAIKVFQVNESISKLFKWAAACKYSFTFRCFVKTSLCWQSSCEYYHPLALYWSPTSMYIQSSTLSPNTWSPECCEWQITSVKSSAIRGNIVPISSSLPPFSQCPAHKHNPSHWFPINPFYTVSTHPDTQTSADWLTV